MLVFGGVEDSNGTLPNKRKFRLRPGSSHFDHSKLLLGAGHSAGLIA